jgi:hypothetical protein
MGILRDTLGGLSEQQVPVLEQLLEMLLFGLTESRLQAEKICRYCDEKTCPIETCPVELKARSVEGQTLGGTS